MATAEAASADPLVLHSWLSKHVRYDREETAEIHKVHKKISDHIRACSFCHTVDGGSLKKHTLVISDVPDSDLLVICFKFKVYTHVCSKQHVSMSSDRCHNSSRCRVCACPTTG